MGGTLAPSEKSVLFAFDGTDGSSTSVMAA